MPTPLFPFTWQYNNQPIEILAENVAGVIANTDKFVPVSNGVGFVDSTLTDDGTLFRTQYQGYPTGISMNYLQRKYSLGDSLTNSTKVTINDPLGTAVLTSSLGGTVKSFGVDADSNTLTAVGVTATTAGSAAAMFLKINVDGTDYKIQLLDA